MATPRVQSSACPASASSPRGCRASLLWPSFSPWPQTSLIVCSRRRRTRQLAQEPLKVREKVVHELLSAGIGCSRRLGKEGEKIPRLLHCVEPICGRSGCEQLFQLLAPLTKRCLIGLDLCLRTAQLGCYLRSHAAMLIEARRAIDHDHCS